MTIYQIDDARPYLTHNGQPVQWHSGSAPLTGLMSSLVRINSRGIAYKPRSWHVRDPLPVWEAIACRPSAFGLCETETSVAFPSQQTPVVNEKLDWLCNSIATARAVTNESRYDFSACDVLDADADFVVVSGTVGAAGTAGTLFKSTTSDLPEWVYWAVCLIVVYLVRCLSKYVLISLSKDKEFPDPVHCVVACVVCVALVVSQGDFVYVTEEELLLYRFTLLYVAVYACLFAGNRLTALFNGLTAIVPAPARNDPPFYNLLAGVMLLVACRLYCGAETPYNPPLIFIIAVRLLVKSRRGSEALRAVTVLLDAFMLSLVCNLGFGPSYHYLTALFAAAAAASDVLVVD